MFNNPLFWQALIFSSFAIGAVVLSAWWLYLSPVRAPLTVVSAPSPKLVLTIALLLLLSGLQLISGAFWDASQHILTGQVPGGADFLWPPHIMIYSAFAIMLIIAGVALRTIAIPARRAGIHDPRLWVRRNPYVGAVALASLYGVFSIPGDAIWHLLFGIDLTAWSPPHVLLGLSTALPGLAAAGMVSRFRPLSSRPLLQALLTSALLATSLNMMYLVGVIEFELPRGGQLVHSVPLWLYPTVGGCIVFFVLILSKRLVGLRWAATLTSVTFYGIRLLVTVGLALTGQVVPYLPVGFLLGAFLVDWLPWDKIPSPILRIASMAVAFAVGYEFMAVPILTARPDIIFSSADLLKIFIVMLVAGVILLPLARWFGRILLGQEAGEAPVVAAAA